MKEMLNEYSGLYAYHCPSNKWSLLRSSIDSSGDLRARMAHSMVFHPVCYFIQVHTHITTLLYRHLVSFTSLEASVVENCSGNTVILFYCTLLSSYSSDLVSYDVESDEVEVLCDGTSSQSESSLVIKLFALNIPAAVPAVGYTLRATLDPIRNQIYLLTVVSLCV